MWTRLGAIGASYFGSENMHRLAIGALSLPRPIRRAAGLVNDDVNDPVLATCVFGQVFRNPIGMAAGFDKNGEAIDGILDLGFGFVEIGAVTLRPQSGNPEPRVFRLEEDRCIINRYGFNNSGAIATVARLRTRARKRTSSGILGINIGMNKGAENPYMNYICAICDLAPYADYLVINVSSPNTPGLCDLQREYSLTNLFGHARLAVKERPLLVKIGPDLSNEEVAFVVSSAVAERLDGIIVCNTTTTRDYPLSSPLCSQPGGLSGPALKARLTRMIADIYRQTQGRLPIIGVGGIESGADALEKIKAGASLVQIYTSFVFSGPAIVPTIKRDLAQLLRAQGFSSVSSAVGSQSV
jgi:dihydroorotate dehydrogenase